ncbi:MAG TPA: hypothetical protein VFQ76_15645, partial [Longimicrobiaceae bacterium]|nr:hypothetical protein [Longimicrobiaceae bacterium]
MPGAERRTPEGWLVVPVGGAVVQRAREMRAERDARYPNLYDEHETDLRWVGEVGEICLYRWLAERAPGAGRWIREDAAGKPDFVVHGHAVGMKTVKRQVPFRPGYTAQITARHAAEPVEHFFFASYEVPRRRLWLLGGISRARFLERARRHGAGERVRPNFERILGHADGPRRWSDHGQRMRDNGRYVGTMAEFYGNRDRMVSTEALNRAFAAVREDCTVR